MKILVSAYACDPTKGGEESIGFNWTWQMQQLGHQVWCLTTPGGRAATESFLAANLDTAPDSGQLHFEDVTVPAWVEFLGRWQFGVYLQYMVWQYQAWRVARRLEPRINFDLVHHATYGSLQMASWLWRLRKPMIVGPVGGGQRAPQAFRRYLPDWFKTETLRNLISWLLVTFDPNVRQNLRYASLVLATNQETADLARRFGASRVELFLDSGIPKSFVPSQFPTREQGPELRLLWLGRLVSRKALPMVLAALGEVDPRVRFHLTVVGDGIMAPLLPDLVRQHGLEGRVTLRGKLPWSEVRDIFLSHDAFLFASLRDSFASQFLEAMATGLPIITLNHQGARDFIPPDAALKVPVTTPEETVSALARAVEHLYDQPSGREAMGRAGYAFARTQTWTERAVRLLQLANQMIKTPPTRTPKAQPTFSSTAN